MKYDPMNEHYDLVVTGKELLTEAMKLFAGYRTTEYHRFASPHACRSWLELDVNTARTKILVFLSIRDIQMYLPEIYCEDMYNATPIEVGCWKGDKPKYRVGNLAVYMTNTYIPLFPIYNNKYGNDYCVVDSSPGRYRAIAIKHQQTPEEAVV